MMRRLRYLWRRHIGGKLYTLWIDINMALAFRKYPDWHDSVRRDCNRAIEDYELETLRLRPRKKA